MAGSSYPFPSPFAVCDHYKRRFWGSMRNEGMFVEKVFDNLPPLFGRGLGKRKTSEEFVVFGWVYGDIF